MNTSAVARICDYMLQTGDILDPDETVETLVTKLKKLQNPHQMFVVVEHRQPIGIVRNFDMLNLLGSKYGAALYYKKRVREIMYKDFVAVDHLESLESVSLQAMARQRSDIYDDVIVVSEGVYSGIITVYELLTYMTEWKVKEAVQRNPLSGLPGNESIQIEIELRKDTNVPFSLLYIDVDYFKSYNDKYGFKKGDELLKWVSQLVLDSSIDNLFVGHIGGDDFVSILKPELALPYTDRMIAVFEEGKHQFYNRVELEQNYMVSYDRKHRLILTPLVSLSIAIIDILQPLSYDFSHFSETIAEIKKQAKLIEGSSYYRGNYALLMNSIIN